jgi:hypothetical protein
VRGQRPNQWGQEEGRGRSGGGGPAIRSPRTRTPYRNTPLRSAVCWLLLGECFCGVHGGAQKAHSSGHAVGSTPAPTQEARTKASEHKSRRWQEPARRRTRSGAVAHSPVLP